LPLGALFRGGPRDAMIIVICTVIAAAGVRLGLLAAWLAWGQLRAVWRLPIVLPSVALSAILWTGGDRREWLEVISPMMFVVLGVTLAAATPRLFGVYRINVFNPPRESADGNVNEGQFRLIDLFAWTATAAVLAGMMRWIGLPRDREWVAIIIFVPVGSLMVLAALWATLTKREQIGFRVLGAFGVAFAVAMILGSFAAFNPEAMFYFFYTLLLAMGFLLGALYIARCVGVRLVSRSLPLIAPPAASTAPSPGPLNEASPEVAAPGLE
jgi:hypothetical protein